MASARDCHAALSALALDCLNSARAASSSSRGDAGMLSACALALRAAATRRANSAGDSCSSACSGLSMGSPIDCDAASASELVESEPSQSFRSTDWRRFCLDGGGAAIAMDGQIVQPERKSGPSRKPSCNVSGCNVSGLSKSQPKSQHRDNLNPGQDIIIITDARSTLYTHHTRTARPTTLAAENRTVSYTYIKHGRRGQTQSSQEVCRPGYQERRVLMRYPASPPAIRLAKRRVRQPGAPHAASEARPRRAP